MSLVHDILALSSNSNMNCAHITGLNNLAVLILTNPFFPLFLSYFPSVLPPSFLPLLSSFLLVLTICTHSEHYTENKDSEAQSLNPTQPISSPKDLCFSKLMAKPELLTSESPSHWDCILNKGLGASSSVWIISHWAPVIVLNVDENQTMGAINFVLVDWESLWPSAIFNLLTRSLLAR